MVLGGSVLLGDTLGSPQGCKRVAGGRQTTGGRGDWFPAPRKGCKTSLAYSSQNSLHPLRVQSDHAD